MKTQLTKTDLSLIADILPNDNLGRMYAAKLKSISDALRPYEFICADKNHCHILIDKGLWDLYHHPEKYSE